ncbi:uncharacterized protein LOC118433295 isoform X2 [Folsomia candida]|uniref:Uncharacterized protein n=1 Tax=Folsomia candida TaxID=158441 RepID=A0A226D240_FOLCA|nr:uncharacterized protein LOC118433295 isoform X2 [Folsomia candida]OXA38346.1 hypothetical protein Fcan01_26895 [Folsomia candida]
MPITGNVIGFLLVLVHYTGILCSSYFFMLSILCFLIGLKGTQINVQSTIGENMETKITNKGWINFLISFTSAVTTTSILVLWIYLNRKLRELKYDEEHNHHGHLRQSHFPFAKTLPILGFLSLSLLLILSTIQFTYEAWFVPFFAGKPNYIAGVTALSFSTLYLLSYFIVLLSFYLSMKCCKGPAFEHDYAGYGAAHGLDERGEKLRRLGRYLQVYYIIKH